MNTEDFGLVVTEKVFNILIQRRKLSNGILTIREIRTLLGPTTSLHSSWTIRKNYGWEQVVQVWPFMILLRKLYNITMKKKDWMEDLYMRCWPIPTVIFG